MAQSHVPRISETEWEIMRILWERHAATCGEIMEQLVQLDPSWHPKTVQTLLTRLVKKGALGYQARGRAHVYEPLVTEKDCVTAVSASFLKRVFRGALKPMLVHFVERQKLSSADLHELEQLLASKRRKR